MRRTERFAAVLAAGVILSGGVEVAPAHATTTVTRAPVVAFQAAGDVGGGVLAPGTTYPPTTQGFAVLQRGTDRVRVKLQTSNLPAGAYTVWWVVFDSPEACSAPCDMDDLLDPDTATSVFYATGGVVRGNGVGTFRARHRLGDDLGEAGTQHILGDGSFNPATAEIHNIVKYHGPASADPAVLEEQISTLWGSCGSGANAVDLGAPFGVQCFDPQAVAHPRP